MRRDRKAARAVASPGGLRRAAVMGSIMGSVMGSVVISVRGSNPDTGRGLSRFRPAVAGLLLAVLLAVPTLAAACRWHCAMGASAGACHQGMAIGAHCAMRGMKTESAAAQAFAATSERCAGRPCRQETPLLSPERGLSAPASWRAACVAQLGPASILPAIPVPASGPRVFLPSISPPGPSSPLDLSGALRV